MFFIELNLSRATANSAIKTRNIKFFMPFKGCKKLKFRVYIAIITFIKQFF